MKTNANINLTMHIIQGFDRTKTAYTAKANFFEKDGKFYLFFEELNPDDGTLTKCRFEICAKMLRLRRNGQVVIEQTHIHDEKTAGYLKTPFGHLDTKLKTFKFSFNRQTDGAYQLALGYDLYTGTEKTGTYLLEIIILPKEEIIS